MIMLFRNLKARIKRMLTRAKNSDPEYKTLPSIKGLVSVEEIREHEQNKVVLEQRLERVSALARIYSRERQ